MIGFLLKNCLHNDDKSTEIKSPKTSFISIGIKRQWDNVFIVWHILMLDQEMF